MDGIHDMGAMHGFGRVPVEATSDGPPWGARLQAVGLLSLGIGRAGLEAIPPDVYLSTGYHEKWLLCAEKRLVDRGRITEESLVRWRELFSTDEAAEVPRTENPAILDDLLDMVTTTPLLEVAESPRFGVGDRVRVTPMRNESHHRCPRYVRGAIGTVEFVPGADDRPESRRGQPDIEPVYTVSFDSRDLWGATATEPPHELLLDLWQSYLEPA